MKHGLRALAGDFLGLSEKQFRICRQPFVHAAKDRGLRKAVVPGFRCVILYKVDKNELIVVAVFHTSRNPDDLHGRM
jgi:plasmid stabilization system protein ParE